MVINVHAGHNPDGKVACGAVSLIKESTEARRVKDEAISQLRQLGHTVYDCTCDNGANQADVLAKIVAACNAHIVDLDVSIHFNSGAKDTSGNGRTTGTEAYVYSASSAAKPYADRVCTSIAGLGYINRGAKLNQNLYYLKKTKAPAMLVECCFVDDKDDVQLYDYQKMAEAIVYGITGQHLDAPNPSKGDPDAFGDGAETATGSGKKLYQVQVGAYSILENAKAMKGKLRAAGFDAVILNA